MQEPLEPKYPAPKFQADAIFDDAKREVLLEIYRAHNELLYRLTQIDLRIIGGYITIQFVSIGFILKLSEKLSPLQFWGAISMDAAIAFVAWMLICRNFQRRDEVAEVMRRLSITLGLREIGFYVKDKRINYRLRDGGVDTPDPIKEEGKKGAKMDIRPWKSFYFTTIIFGSLGFLLIILSKT